VGPLQVEGCSLRKNRTFYSQDWQIALKLVFGYLAPVLVPFDFFILDESIKNMVAKGFFHEFTFFRELDRSNWQKTWHRPQPMQTSSLTYTLFILQIHLDSYNERR